jgi:uncharacterized protein (DUF2267 family)
MRVTEGNGCDVISEAPGGLGGAPGMLVEPPTAHVGESSPRILRAARPSAREVLAGSSVRARPDGGTRRASSRDMSYERYLETIRAAGGLRDRAEASRVATATLEALGMVLDPFDAEALAELLPQELARALVRRRGEPAAIDPDELARRVGAIEGVPVGFAREHAGIVCSALSDLLDEEGLRLFEARVPALLWPLFEARPRDGEPLVRARGARTLAGGRPGSTHPLFESRASRAHSGSPAATADPHADSRIASAHGLTQDREHESIATGRPGSSRPLSERSPRGR